MGQLTIRTTPEQEALIAKVQALSGEKTASKTLIAALYEFEPNRAKIRELQKKIEALENDFDNLKSVVVNYQNSQKALLNINI
ncbi:TPA: hypothetical protein PXO68_003162 [Yersinia enterocolitica]|uniref:Uncharacterized protein n=2 Tax=Yersinia TaxID=629 RepID=A0A0U1QTA3_YERP3|nr:MULTISPECIES: hypothetical protein [Yersinia]EKN4882319.1 hypothetical protein [Yersinia enterocolitica]ABS45612.1 hypothetical protein YpsIP31758_A0008 [Yersinia pseudotuberculosis IP 31758]AVX40712.1 hypothetical protein DA391_23855 [Yersinia massiliensis]EKN5104284.1 hypothetical protein [Yersinia enterocolitica]EKN6091052.1 hypothetical protein [Yersinia enterocolitica]